jgi:hypothetical protein
LQRLFRLFQRFDVLKQLRFLLPFRSDGFERHAIEDRHHQQHRDAH